jgi:hypothetical protein
MMTWNYRITRQRAGAEFEFTIREVYYDETGTVVTWTQDAVAAHGDTREECVAALARMMDDAESRPVLDVDTGEDA